MHSPTNTSTHSSTYTFANAYTHSSANSFTNACSGLRCGILLCHWIHAKLQRVSCCLILKQRYKHFLSCVPCRHFFQFDKQVCMHQLCFRVLREHDKQYCMQGMSTGQLLW